MLINPATFLQFSAFLLVTQHCEPPYRAIGYSYTYRIYVSRYRKVSRHSPPFELSQNYVEGGGLRGGLGGGGIAGQCCPLRYRAL